MIWIPATEVRKPTDNDATESPSRIPKFLRWGWRGWSVFVLLLVVLAGGTLGLAYWNTRDLLAEEYDALHEAGYPTTLKELNVWYALSGWNRQPPDRYEKAFAAIEGLETEKKQIRPLIDSIDEYRWIHNYPDSFEEELRAFCTKYAEAITAVHEGADAGPVHFPLDYRDGWDTSLRHLPRIRSAASLMVLESELAFLNGDLDASIQAHRRLSSIYTTLDTQPMVIGHLVRLVIVDAAVNLLARQLSYDQYHQRHLETLRDIYDQRLRLEEFRRSLVAQLCMAEVIEDLYVHLAKESRGNKAVTGDARQLLRPLMGFRFNWERLLVVQKVALTLELECNTWWELRSAIEELPTISPRTLVAFTAVPDVHRAVDRFARSEAGLRCAQTAIAAELHRLEYGQVPAELPKIERSDPEVGALRILPADPFDGRPLRYVTNGANYKVYSVYQNERDDGGVPYASEIQDACDWIFEVRRPGSRPIRDALSALKALESL